METTTTAQPVTIPTYDNDVQNHLTRVLAIHSSDDLKRLHYLLFKEFQAAVDGKPLAERAGMLAEYKKTHGYKTEQVIQDILKVRKDKGVYI